MDEHEKKYRKKRRKSKAFRVIKKVYALISVLSSLTILGGLLLFVFGRISNYNVTDNTLIYKDILAQIPENYEVREIKSADLFGTGNQTIIVVANEMGIPQYLQGENALEKSIEQERNRKQDVVFLFDTINNNILSQINNFMGYGSNYRLVYQFALSFLNEDGSFDDHFNGYMKIGGFEEMTGDNIKEIIMHLDSGGSGGYYDIAILSYSIEVQKYYFLGSYPAAQNVKSYRDGNTDSYDLGYLACNYFEPDKQVLCGVSTYRGVNFFAKVDGSSRLFRAVPLFEGECNACPHRYAISVFEPCYNQYEDIMEWRELYYEETEEKVPVISSGFVVDYLIEKGVVSERNFSFE